MPSSAQQNIFLITVPPDLLPPAAPVPAHIPGFWRASEGRGGGAPFALPRPVPLLAVPSLPVHRPGLGPTPSAPAGGSDALSAGHRPVLLHTPSPRVQQIPQHLCEPKYKYLALSDKIYRS